ncbi:hypothetical protein GCM10027075_22800 [Streptomyces heilongjiangensis]
MRDNRSTRETVREALPRVTGGSPFDSAQGPCPGTLDTGYAAWARIKGQGPHPSCTAGWTLLSRPDHKIVDRTKIRDGAVANQPVYVALAVTTEGRREILGLWAGDGGEGAKHWPHMLTEIKNRGMTGKGQARWTMRWKTALNAFDITFDGRLSAARQ